MSSNDDILREIAKLQGKSTLILGAIDRAKRKRNPPTAFKPSKNLTLNSEFVKKGNKLVRLGTEASKSIRPVQPPKTNVLPSAHKKLVIKDGKAYKSSRSTLVSTDLIQNKTISIDGVEFIVKGRKLTRKTESLPTKTPKRIQLNGISYVRTKSGNLIKAPSNWKRNSKFCQFFGRFGKCKNTKCPFVHDPNRITVCTRHLSDSCTNPNCLFSHLPNEFNTPICKSSLMRKECKKDCLFVHFPSVGSSICLEFLKYGYCDKGLKCESVHLFACPDYFENEKCENANCKYKHDSDPTLLLTDDSSQSELESDWDEINEEDILKIYVAQDDAVDDFSQ